RAAAEALLVEAVILVVRARRRPTPRAHGAPVATLQDRGPLARSHRLRPLVDVAGHVVNAERALAARPRPRRDALPEPVELGSRGRPIPRPQRSLVERTPGLVDDARFGIAHVAVRVGRRFFALAGERPLGFVTEALGEARAEIARLVPRDEHDRIRTLL